MYKLGKVYTGFCDACSGEDQFPVSLVDALDGYGGWGISWGGRYGLKCKNDHNMEMIGDYNMILVCLLLMESGMVGKDHS